jgi:glycerophosphoryl diester phosphodiesterase
MRANPSPLVIGHRGASGYRPEHTSAAYDLAFSLGADAVEPDIVATRDGVLVLRHENEISSTTNIADHSEFSDRRATKEIDGTVVSGWFTEDFTWAELATLRARERLGSLRQASASFDGMYPILRLSDLFELVSRRSDDEARLLGIVAELKHATYFESVGLALDELFVAELDGSGWSHNPSLVVESFEKSVLGKLHRRGYRGKRVYLVEAAGAPADRVAALGSAAPLYAEDVSQFGLYSLGAAAPAERVEGVSVPLSMLTGATTDESADEAASDAADAADAAGADFVDQAHAASLEVFCWTLRPENKFLPERFRHGKERARYGDWLGRFRAIMRTGVDGVFADHPDLAVVARSSL